MSRDVGCVGIAADLHRDLIWGWASPMEIAQI